MIGRSGIPDQTAFFGIPATKVISIKITAFSSCGCSHLDLVLSKSLTSQEAGFMLVSIMKRSCLLYTSNIRTRAGIHTDRIAFLHEIRDVDFGAGFNSHLFSDAGSGVTFDSHL